MDEEIKIVALNKQIGKNICLATCEFYNKDGKIINIGTHQAFMT